MSQTDTNDQYAPGEDLADETLEGQDVDPEEVDPDDRGALADDLQDSAADEEREDKRSAL